VDPLTGAGVVVAVSAPVLAVSHALTTGSSPAPLLLLTAVLAACAVAVLARPTGRLGTTFATGAALLAGHAVLATLAGVLGGVASAGQGCLSAVGRGARIGLWLALLEPDRSCPAGSYAPGPAALIAPVLLAVAILAAHTAAALAAGLLAALAGVVTPVRRLALRIVCAVGVLRARLAAKPALPSRPASVRSPGAPRPGRQVLWRPVVVRRGPPALCRA